ncbi:hypothetical protein [Gracilibacillus xinjiangensis]|uniref:Uncharacterized protein n=1 Tax=Gracilibacillus xinjiangensis TaxID=1193282 RepID=A0ABV8WVN0_9BACI
MTGKQNFFLVFNVMLTIILLILTIIHDRKVTGGSLKMNNPL